MQIVTVRIRQVAAELWWWLRQASGDAAYDNYLRAARTKRSGTGLARPLTREEFYLDALRRRYSGVSRCC